MDRELDIAVVGGGVAGVVAAHILQRAHRVTLFEKNAYLGGHTNTVAIPDGPDAGTPVDTGFIVLNDRTYPLLHRFFGQLGVAVRFGDMSFGCYCERSGLQYAGTDLNQIFAQRANAVRPSFWRMLLDIRRFGAVAPADLESGELEGRTLADYVAQKRFSDIFVNDYLIPMGAAIWSASRRELLDFPAEAFMRFFKNHGLLTLRDRPQWQTVVGGSHDYIQKFQRLFEGTIHTGLGAVKISRGVDNVSVSLDNGETRDFDKVVIAAHADQALRLLADPSPEESKWLGAWTYSNNRTVLHTDESVMPPNRRAWASWNYTREKNFEENDPVSVTYDMNRLQGLNTKRRYFVTLNRKRPVREESVIREFDYTHPTYTFESLKSQDELARLNGQRNTFYCGSYFGYGFHEDAVRSASGVGALFGLNL